MMIYFFILSACSSSDKENKKNKIFTETDSIIENIYSKYPEFYPKVFDLDSTNKRTYFYNIFKEVKYIQDYQDSISYKIFKGCNGSTGRYYKIVIITYRNNKHTIPIDIETGDGIQMLNDAFTPLWLSINKTQKGKRNILIIDKLIRECLDLTPTTLNSLNKLPKPIWKGRTIGENSQISNQRKAFDTFINQISDSAIYFNKEDGFQLNIPGKYLPYFDNFSQVFIVSLDSEKIQFKFYNPLNIRHYYF